MLVTSSDAFQIFIRVLGSYSLLIYANHSDSILQLKIKINGCIGIPILSFCGHRLLDLKTCQFYQIQHENIIFLTSLLPGGSKIYHINSPINTKNIANQFIKYENKLTIFVFIFINLPLTPFLPRIIFPESSKCALYLLFPVELNSPFRNLLLVIQIKSTMTSSNNQSINTNQRATQPNSDLPQFKINNASKISQFQEHQKLHPSAPSPIIKCERFLATLPHPHEDSEYCFSVRRPLHILESRNSPNYTNPDYTTLPHYSYESDTSSLSCQSIKVETQEQLNYSLCPKFKLLILIARRDAIFFDVNTFTRIGSITRFLSQITGISLTKFRLVYCKQILHERTNTSLGDTRHTTLRHYGINSLSYCFLAIQYKKRLINSSSTYLISVSSTVIPSSAHLQTILILIFKQQYIRVIDFNYPHTCSNFIYTLSTDYNGCIDYFKNLNIHREESSYRHHLLNLHSISPINDSYNPIGQSSQFQTLTRKPFNGTIQRRFPFQTEIPNIRTISPTLAYFTLPKTRYQNSLYTCSWINTQESNIYSMQKLITQKEWILEPINTPTPQYSTKKHKNYNIYCHYHRWLSAEERLQFPPLHVCYPGIIANPKESNKDLSRSKNNFIIEDAIGSHPNKESSKLSN